ncbi:hypothetical protein HK102_013380 [Quaeritorhiza haematococci]|nr:hypothetical protein HK102_013380 [Quaeritorhiza haematococci]
MPRPTVRIPLFAMLLLFIVVSSVTVGIVTWYLTRQSGEQTIQMLITRLQEKYVDFFENVLAQRLKTTQAAAVEIRELWQDGAFLRRPWQEEELKILYSMLKGRTLFVSSMHFTTLDGNLFGWGALENSTKTNATLKEPDIITANAYILYKMEGNVYHEYQYDVDGKLLWKSDLWPNHDATTEPWVQVLVQNKSTRAWTRPYQRWITYAARAINQTTGETIMYTGADVSIPFIGQTLKRYTQNDTIYKMQVYVLDTTDKYILGSSDSSFEPYLTTKDEEFTDRPVYLSEIAPKNDYVGVINRTLSSSRELWEADDVQTIQYNLQGRQLFITFKRLRLDSKNTWLIVQVADGTDVIKLVDSNFHSSIITLCGVLVAISVAGFLFSLSIGKALAGLIADLHKLAKYDFTAVTYLKIDAKRSFHTIKEISAIQVAFLETVKEFANHLKSMTDIFSNNPPMVTTFKSTSVPQLSRSCVEQAGVADEEQRQGLPTLPDKSVP